MEFNKSLGKMGCFADRYDVLQMWEIFTWFYFVEQK